ncbi:Hypothetical predicted protein, partial [Pelobates cultripes]
MAHVEQKLSEFTKAHNDIADHVQALEHKIELMEVHMADSEDRSWRNNLHLRGIPKDVLPCDLQAY